jgi:hypothetical protein
VYRYFSALNRNENVMHYGLAQFVVCRVTLAYLDDWYSACVAMISSDVLVQKYTVVIQVL